MLTPDFHHFPVVMHPFRIPEHWVWFRYCDSNEVLSHHIRFFGSENTAELYALNRVKRTFRNTKPLRLMDMRYVVSMMRQMVASRRTERVSVEAMDNLEVLNMALGLCSYSTQINLLTKIQNQSLFPEVIKK